MYKLTVDKLTVLEGKRSLPLRLQKLYVRPFVVAGTHIARDADRPALHMR